MSMSLLPSLYRSIKPVSLLPPPSDYVEKASTVMAAVAQAAVYETGPLGLAQPEEFLKFMRVFSKQPTVYRCVTVIANALASVNLKFYEVKENTDDRKELPFSHPLIQLFRKPNPLMTGHELKLHWGLSLELTGNAYWEIAVGVNEHTGEEKLELWPINPGNTRIVPDRFRGVRGYIYTINRKPIPLPIKKVFHTRYINPNHEFYGIAPMVSASRALDAEDLLMRHANALLKNSARPSGILMIDGDLTGPQQERLRTEWEQLYQGADNAGRTAIVSRGKSYTTITMTPEQIQLIETRQWHRDELMVAYGLYPIFFGILERATLENAEMQWKMFWKTTMEPKLAMLEDQITDSLLPRFGIHNVVAEFDRTELDAFKDEAREEMLSLLPALDRGVITINEIRKDTLKKPPQPWGAKPWMSSGLVQLGADNAMPAPTSLLQGESGQTTPNAPKSEASSKLTSSMGGASAAISALDMHAAFTGTASAAESTAIASSGASGAESGP